MRVLLLQKNDNYPENSKVGDMCIKECYMQDFGRVFEVQVCVDISENPYATEDTCFRSITDEPFASMFEAQEYVKSL